MKKFQGTGVFLRLGGVLFLVATLFYPCIPFSDPTGETVFLSRIDYALAVLGYPEAVWGLWLGGGDVPFLADRIPILWRSAVTIGLSWPIGHLLVKLDRLDQNIPRFARFCISAMVGYLFLNFAMFLLQRWFSIDHWIWPFSAIAICLGGLWLANRLVATRWNWRGRDNANWHEDLDPTLGVSWKRRVFGLCSIGICILFCVQILGASLPTVDEDVRRDVWWRLLSKANCGQKDNSALWEEDAKHRKNWLSKVAFPTIDYVSVLWIWESAGAKARAENDGRFEEVPRYIQAMVQGKVLITVITWLGFVFIATYVREEQGKLPAVIVLLLLGSTPCFIELERLGRVESLFGVVIASLPIVYRYSRRTGTVPVCCFAVLSYPFIVWLIGCFLTEPDSNYLRPEAMARFLGFSTLHAVGFVPLVSIGVLARGGGKERWMVVVAVFIFLVVGLYFAKLDRCWVPCLCLFAFSAARGVSLFVRDQSVWMGLPIWICILFFSIVGGIAWPTLDNRILVSYGEMMRSQWQYRESLSDSADVSQRYVLELRNQMSIGKLGKSPKLLLIGDWDDLDLPMACAVWLDRDPREVSMSVERYIEQGITHIALVSQVAPADRLLSIDEEQKVRLELEARKDKGQLKTMTVSASCRELTLYAVNFVDSPTILFGPTTKP